MRKPTPGSPALCALSVLILTIGAAGAALGDPVAWWRFDEASAAAGQPIVVAENEVTPGHLDGVGQNGATYSGTVPSPDRIYDPLTGWVHTNAFSMDMSGSGYVEVPDDSDLHAPSFTIEAFIRLGGNVGTYDQADYVTHRLPDPSFKGWRVDINSNEEGRARFYTYPQPVQVVGGKDSTEYLGDGAWHHTAVTFDGTTKQIKYYLDYSVTDTITLNGTASNVTDVAYALLLGSWDNAPADTYLDEVRYFNNAVSSSSQFLRAWPGLGGTWDVVPHAELRQAGQQLFGKAYAEIDMGAGDVALAETTWELFDISGSDPVLLDSGLYGLGGPDFDALLATFPLGTTMSLRLTSTFDGEQAVAEGTFTFVPEPATLALLALGALGVAACARRTRRRKSSSPGRNR